MTEASTWRASDDAETRALRTMAAVAETLLRCEDQLMLGQYRHLAGRIAALLAIREAELALDATEEPA